MKAQEINWHGWCASLGASSRSEYLSRVVLCTQNNWTCHKNTEVDKKTLNLSWKHWTCQWLYYSYVGFYWNWRENTELVKKLLKLSRKHWTYKKTCLISFDWKWPPTAKHNGITILLICLDFLCLPALRASSRSEYLSRLVLCTQNYWTCRENTEVVNGCTIPM